MIGVFVWLFWFLGITLVGLWLDGSWTSEPDRHRRREKFRASLLEAIIAGLFFSTIIVGGWYWDALMIKFKLLLVGGAG